MLRIEFSLHDLARVRLMTAHAPVAETMFAINLLHCDGGGKPFERWRRAVRAQLGPLANSLGPHVRSLRFTPELFTMREGAFNRAERPFMAVCDGQESAAAVHRFYQIAVAPYWKRVHSYLEAEHASRSVIALSAGIEGLLSTLDPLAKWKPPVLEISAPFSKTVRLDGRGLLITPSLFHAEPPNVFLCDSSRSSPVLVYPTPFNVTDAKSLWNLSAPDERMLNALIGRTRAGVLRALSQSHTTTGLSRRLGVSPAAVSQHTSILRDAGLIITRRKRNSVWHSLTPLGLALLNDSGSDLGAGEAVAGDGQPKLRAVNGRGC
jgi:DNA-binding transcriptional ArsR family regulator